ncbi:MAG: TnpV protein [Oscillospiraceae bacterium]|nr:TnpV protein [Oscillospiraceae bacterium]
MPNDISPESPNIGIWGERRRQFLMKHKNPIYAGRLLRGELNIYLEEIDLSANEIFDTILCTILLETM